MTRGFQWHRGRRSARRTSPAPQAALATGYHVILVECWDDGKLRVSLDTGSFEQTPEGRRMVSEGRVGPATGEARVDPVMAADQIEMLGQKLAEVTRITAAKRLQEEGDT